MVIIGILSIFWYHGNLEMKVLNYGGIVPGGGGRTILGHHFERLTSIIGGASSNVAIFLGAGLVISLGFLMVRGFSKRSKIVFVCLGSLCAYASLLAVSRSVVVLLMVSLSAFAVSGITSRVIRTAFLCIVAVFFLGVVIGISFNEVTLLSLIRQNSVNWWRAAPDNIGEWLIGSGLRSAGGGLLGENAEQSIAVDGGWPQIISMTGLVGITMITSFLLVFAVDFYRLASCSMLLTVNKREYALGVTAGAAALGLLAGSAHTAVIFRPVVDIAFYALAAVMVSIYSNGTNRKPAWFQRETQG